MMPRSPAWRLVLAIAALSLFASTLPSGLDQLAWHRDAMAGGQWFRLLTGHFVHLDAHHLLINLLGLAVLTNLLIERWQWRELICLLFISTLGTSTLLWWFTPELIWYAGLSGVLHGLWAGAALCGLCGLHQPNHPSERPWCLLSLLALSLKLGWLNHPTSSIPVVPLAHLFGAISGLFFSLLHLLWEQFREID